MNPFKAVLEQIESFLEAQAVRYREAYLAQMKHLPESEQRTGHRGVYLP